MIGDLVNKILQESAPPSDVAEVKIIEGVTARFRILVDMEERTKTEEQALLWARDYQKVVQGGRCLPAWKDVATDNLGILAQVKMLSLLAMDEDFQSELAWLTIAKKACPIFAGVVRALDELASNKTSDYAVYVEQKKD
jgi:hypothetical protein